MNRSIARFLFVALVLLSLCVGACAQEAGFIGRWRCLSFVYDGSTYVAADVDFEAIFDLSENGVAAITLNGETEAASWRVENGAPVVAAVDGVYTFVKNEDMLEMTDGGVLMRFACEPGAERGSQSPPPVQDASNVNLVDERIELVILYNRLAGHPSFVVDSLETEYMKELADQFDAFKTHPAVLSAPAIRADAHIQYNFALHIKEDMSGLVDDLDGLLMDHALAGEFWQVLSGFYADTGFGAFYQSKIPFYIAQSEPFAQIAVDLDWLVSYAEWAQTPKEDQAAVSPSISDYDYCLDSTSGKKLALLGSFIDEDARKPTLIHEYCHYFCSSASFTWVNLKQFYDLCKASDLSGTAYENNGFMIANEYMTRAFTILYFEDHGDAQTALACARDDKALGFIYVDEVCALIREYREYFLRGVSPRDFLVIMSDQAANVEEVLQRAKDVGASRSNENMLAFFDLAIAQNASAAAYHFHRGICLRELGRDEEALAAYDEAIRLDPSLSPSMYSLKASILFDLYRFGEAKQAYEKALAMKPDDKDYQEMCEAMEQLTDVDTTLVYGESLKAEQNYGPMLALYEDAIAYIADIADFHTQRGFALYMLSRYEEALAAIDEAIRMDPLSANAYSLRGEMLARQDRYEEAKPSFAKAVELEPDNELYQAQYEWIMAALGE